MNRQRTHRPWKAPRTLLWLALALVGCGPGTGGTGTGPGEYLIAFSAAPASLCSASFATQLACPASVSSPSQPDPTRGTAMVHFADVAQGGNIAMRIEEDSIEFTARCQRIRFEGRWGITAAQDARFFGSYRVEPAGPQLTASLSVQATAGKRGELTVVLREIDGRVVLGPVTLQSAPAPVTSPAACPS